MPQRVPSHTLGDCLHAHEHERRRDVLAALQTASAVNVTALVDWDRETGRVHRGPRFDDTDALLKFLHTHEDDLTWKVG